MEVITMSIYHQANNLPDEVVEKILDCLLQFEVSSHEVSFLTNQFYSQWSKSYIV
jgi:hypothetical protein